MYTFATLYCIVFIVPFFSKAYVNPLDLITDEERMTFNAGEG